MKNNFSLQKLLMLLVFMLAISNVSANPNITNLSRQEILISGVLENNYVAQLIEKIQKGNEKLFTSVRFERCRGGRVGASLKLAQAIRSAGLATVASGQVSSGCAVAFLGGVRRTVDQSAGRTIIVFHNASDGQGKMPSNNELIIKEIERLVDLRWPESAREIVKTTATQVSGLVFYFDYTTANSDLVVLGCDGSLGEKIFECPVVPNLSAKNLGVVTD